MAKARSNLVLEKRVHGGVTAPPQYLSGLDVFHSFAFFPLVLVYPQGLDVDAMERGLAQVLKLHPHVSGRYKKDKAGQVYVESNDAGVDLRVHRHAGPLTYGEANPVGKATMSLVKLVLPWRVVGRDTPFLQVNVHQFADGGAVLALYATHSLFDGASFWAFMMDWSKACRGLEIKPPATDRQVVIQAGRDALQSDAYDLLAKPTLWGLVRIFAGLGWRTLSITSASFRLSPEVIQRWKDEGKAEQADGASATGASLGSLAAAYVLRAISPMMPRDVVRSVGLVQDLRYKRNLGIAREYVGNALCYVEARYTQQQLEQESLGSLAEQCRAPADQVSTTAINKMLATMEQYRQKRANWRLLFKPTVETLKGGLILNNCMQFPMYKVDLGSGVPNWYEMPPATIRLLLLVPTPSQDGGVDMMLCAPQAEIDALRARFEADRINTRLGVSEAA